ncbi:MAG: hypothetical protein KGL39_34830 [Patescibacteria group bacterium]|nr:hypothetical protein [Patescibacteria group bacterium]
MPRKPWTAEEEVRARTMRGNGKTFEEIATALGRSFDSVRRKFRDSHPQPSVPPQEMAAMRESARDGEVRALREELAALKAKVEPKRLPVTTEAEPPTDPADLWSRSEADSKKAIAYACQRTQFQLAMPAEVIGVSFISDQHIAPGTPVDFERMRLDAELIQRTPGLYAVLGGDCVDNHIKHRAAVLAARSQPHDQWALFEYYLSIFAEKIIAMCSGNHDAFSDQIAGIDVLAGIAHRQRLCYAPAEARIDLKLGEQEYKLAMRHQYRFNSSFNLAHTVKQWWRMGEKPFDIGVIGHHHEPAIESFDAHGLERWAARPGSYQITSAYSRQYGFNRTRPTCPTFILFPDRREIVGFRDVQKAVKCLAAERGE